MTSTLYRLLTYANGTAVEARENFTTEALSACIEVEPTPMERALRECGVIAPTMEIGRLTSLTQVFVSGAGFLDLVLRTGSSAGVPEVWIEVKVDAPESGSQLRNYLKAIDSIEVHRRPKLAVLGPRPLGDPGAVSYLSWQVLWHAAIKNNHWRDFAAYLKEIGMADEYNEPIRTREAAALDDARRLMRKLARALVPVTVQLKQSWPSASYPTTEGEVRQALVNQLNRNGRYTLSNQNASRAALVFGVGWMDDESWLTVRIEHNAKRGQDRLQIIEAADSGGLPATWQRLLVENKALRVDRRLASFDAPSEITGWVLQRIEELRGSGVLTVIDDLDTSPPVELEPTGSHGADNGEPAAGGDEPSP